MILENMAAKGTDPEPPTLIEPELLLSWHHYKKRFPAGPQKLKNSLLRPL